jgi:hypothetical protein
VPFVEFTNVTDGYAFSKIARSLFSENVKKVTAGSNPAIALAGFSSNTKSELSAWRGM